MEKLISLIMALAMVLGMGTVAFGATVHEVASVGELKTALANVADGDTIKLTANITFTSSNATVNGSWYDGIVYEGDKSFTLDLNGFTVTDDGIINDYLIYIKNTVAGGKASEITIKNGTVETKNGSHGTIVVGSNSTVNKITVNLEDLNAGNKNSASFQGNNVIRARKNSIVNINSGCVITSDNASACVMAAAADAVVNVKSGATLIQKNSASDAVGNNVYANITGVGTVNVYDGAVLESDKYCAYTSTSGTPVFNFYGGSVESGKIAFVASTDNNNYSGAKATINVKGGEVSAPSVAAELNTNTSEKVSEVEISGGEFTADPSDFVSATVGAKATVTSANKTTYAVGEKAVQEAAKNASAGDVISVEGSIALENVPEGVIIENANDGDATTEQKVSVNGIEVPKGERVEAPAVEEEPVEVKPTPAEDAVVIELGGNAKEEEEANPNTGAPVILPVAVIAALSGAVLSKRK